MIEKPIQPPQQESREDHRAEFRELFPERFWSAEVKMRDLRWEQFSQLLKEIATERKFTFSGFRFVSEYGKFDKNRQEWVPAPDEMYYYFSRYPRHAFPIPSIDECRQVLSLIEEKAKEKYPGAIERPYGQEEAQLTSSSHVPRSFYPYGVKGNELPSRFRVLLGLNEGYEREKPITHTIDEVRKAIGDDFDLKDAMIYTIGHWGEYTEPAVVITGNPAQLQKVYKLAEGFKQERFAVENFSQQLSWMVETKWCKKPDTEVITLEQITSIRPSIEMLNVEKNYSSQSRKNQAISLFNNCKPFSFETPNGKITFVPRLYTYVTLSDKDDAYSGLWDYYMVVYVLKDMPENIVATNPELAESLQQPNWDDENFVERYGKHQKGYWDESNNRRIDKVELVAEYSSTEE